MEQDLKGRSVLVTGAARGIGEAVARLAAARGARVAVVGLEPERLRALADDLGATWREADVRDSDALRQAIDDCADELGGIELLVANAGVVAYGTVRQIDDASFERVLDVNVNGVFRTLKYATPHLAESRGHVLVIASALSFMPLAAMASYGASKATSTELWSACCCHWPPAGASSSPTGSTRAGLRGSGGRAADVLQRRPHDLRAPGGAPG